MELISCCVVCNEAGAGGQYNSRTRDVHPKEYSYAILGSTTNKHSSEVIEMENRISDRYCQ